MVEKDSKENVEGFSTTTRQYTNETNFNETNLFYFPFPHIKDPRKVDEMANIPLLHLFDDMVRKSEVLSSGIEKGIIFKVDFFVSCSVVVEIQ